MARRIVGMLIGVVLLAGLAGADGGDPNVVKNGGFEEANLADPTLPLGWRRWQSKPETAYRDLENPHKGAASLTVKTNIAGGWQVLEQWVECKPGTSYEVHFFGKTNGSVKGTVAANAIPPGEKKPKRLNSLTFGNTDWAEHRLIFKTRDAAGDVSTCKVVLRIYPAAWKVEDGQIWADEVTAVPVSE